MDIRVKWYYRIGFLLLLLIAIFIFLKISPLWMPIVKIIGIIIFPFIIAGFITYLLHPIVEKLHEKGLHRGLAIILIYFIFFGGIGFSLYKGIPVVIDQIKDLSESAPVFAEQYRDWIALLQKHTREWPDGLQARVDEGIDAFENKLNSLLTIIVNILVNILNSALLMMIIPFITFYMLKDYPLLKRTVWYLTPKKWRKKGSLFLKDVDQSLGGYIRGQLLVCVIIGSISSLLFWIFHLNYPLLLGLIVGATNVIPYFGPIIGAVPAVIIAATISMKLVIITIVIVFGLQFLEGNILSPYIVGKSLHMHPLLIMAALTTGGEVGGILGLILAVPILAVLKVGIIHAKNHLMKESN
ncbi:AI-2E family transporter [Bacillus sp. AFS076308]|uniref:AI-2E family transporter n=1 Tax=unclassified Bacillus (in: firmicutes) TaxID=185979 RepID=UPI000BF74FA2|nr:MULTISPECIES: AI-2E family transporter [unclassified Bacillus (in: firmicutes)]PFO03614.1 AI-2E family transporter [Bacillus sp. AFS076308]PGV54345.1 AI-2E family transporter [Bacillus sp. AFS037270]